MIDALYLHFPFCRHLCNYCDFYKKKTISKDEFTRYEKYLENSWDKHQALLNKHDCSWAPLDTFYIGGGTPSLWGESGVHFFKKLFTEKNLSFSSEPEVTLEVNPGSWTDEGIHAWKSVANRFSLGIQSLDEKFLKLLDRVHDVEDVHETLKKFQKLNFDFSVDFMLGLPYSQEFKRDIVSELKEILTFNPQHISLYILTVGSGYPHKKHLPDEDWIEKEYLEVSSYLQSVGFEHYEVSNFAKLGKKSRHNLKYWKSESVAALGPSATGFLSKANLRYRWSHHWEKKTDFSLEELSPTQMRLEQFYMAMRTSEGVAGSDFFSGEELAEFDQLAESWSERGLVKKPHDHSKVIATPRGYLVMDSLMGELFSRVKSL